MFRIAQRLGQFDERDITYNEKVNVAVAIVLSPGERAKDECAADVRFQRENCLSQNVRDSGCLDDQVSEIDINRRVGVGAICSLVSALLKND
jgi:hypothetical protein